MALFRERQKDQCDRSSGTRAEIDDLRDATRRHDLCESLSPRFGKRCNAVSALEISRHRVA